MQTGFLYGPEDIYSNYTVQSRPPLINTDDSLTFIKHIKKHTLFKGAIEHKTKPTPYHLLL